MPTAPLLAVSAPVAAGYVIALYSLVFAPGAVAALKGHGIWLLAGIIASPLVWWYAALFRSAKPRSWWADHVYDPEGQRRSIEEWGSDEAGRWTLPVGAAFVAFPLTIGITMIVLAL
jgi:hypothetical protein